MQSMEEQGALKLAQAIEDAVTNPEAAVKRINKKMGLGGIIGEVIKTIVDFIRDYRNKDAAMSDEEWMKQQFAKPEYAEAWKGKDAEKERDEAARGLVQGIEGYENAKKSLSTHIKMGGTGTSWLAEQIEIGAANNNKDPAEYAKEIEKGLEAAREENAEFLLDGSLTKEAE